MSLNEGHASDPYTESLPLQWIGYLGGFVDESCKANIDGADVDSSRRNMSYRCQIEESQSILDSNFYNADQLLCEITIFCQDI